VPLPAPDLGQSLHPTHQATEPTETWHREDRPVLLDELRALRHEDLIGRPHLALEVVAVDRDDGRGGDEAHAAGAQAQPELVVEEPVQLHAQQSLAGLDHRAAEERRGLRDRGRERQRAGWPARAIVAEDPAALADERGVAVHDACLRMPHKGSDDPLDGVHGEEAVVAVHPADDLTGARLERLVDGVRLSAIRLARPADRVAGLGEDRRRLVGRVAVGDYVLDPLVGLPCDGAEAVAKEAPLVEGRSQDRDERQVRRLCHGRPCLVRTTIG
jgi:hypothetical protein